MSSAAGLTKTFSNVSVVYRFVPGFNQWSQGWWLLKNGLRGQFSLQREAISDVTLEVVPGRVVCVIGENGSGKTSLLRAITGSWIPGYWRRSPDVTINDQLDSNAARPEALFHKRFDGSDDLLEEIRRVAALIDNPAAANPPFVVIDEPTRNLDSKSIEEVSRLINKIQGQGVGVVIATHDIPFSLDVSNKLLHLQSGQSVCELDVSTIKVDVVDNRPDSERDTNALITKDIVVSFPEVESYGYTRDYLQLALNQQMRSRSSNGLGEQPFVPGVDSEVFRDLPIVPDGAKKVQEAKGLSVVFKQGNTVQGAKGENKEGAKSALRNVNAHVREGEILALIGPSGCGKSTYLKAINRMLADNADIEGTVEVSGTDTSSIEVEELRRNCGFVAQKAQCMPHMSIMKEVTYPASLQPGFIEEPTISLTRLVRGSLKKVGLLDKVEKVVSSFLAEILQSSEREKKGTVQRILDHSGLSQPLEDALLGLITEVRTPREKMAEDLLKKVGLWDEVKSFYTDKKRSGTSLSGGQQQRLTVARALAVHPKFLLMDEPCSHLDPISTAKVEELIRNLNQQYGVTVIIVTHEMSQAARLAHRTAVVWEGEIIEEGNTQDILNNPQDPRTKSFVCKPGTYQLDSQHLTLDAA